jgi:hypothetical protein
MPEQEVSINETYKVILISKPSNWNDKCFSLCKLHADNGNFFSHGKKYSERGLKSFIEQHDPILKYADENVEKAVEKALSQSYQKPSKTLDDLTN